MPFFSSQKNISVSVIIFFIFQINSYTQTTLKGKVQSEGEGVAYALVLHTKMKQPVYTDSLGNFEITNLTAAETLTINCIGYEEKTVLVKNLNHPLIIELEKNSTLLDEMVIYKINSRWKSSFKKPKPHLWKGNFNLFEGNVLLTKYKAPKDLTFNGIAFIIKNANANHKTKKIRPLIFKNSINNSNSLIDNEIKTFRIPVNIEPPLSKIDYRTEFEFDYLIKIKKGEEFYVGMELIRNDVKQHDRDFNNSIMVACIKEISSTDLETAIYFNFFNEAYHNNDFNRTIDSKDLYFELKILED